MYFIHYHDVFLMTFLSALRLTYLFVSCNMVLHVCFYPEGTKMTAPSSSPICSLLKFQPYIQLLIEGLDA